ncbi:hypothetical protein MMYC01_204238 [Madurella mycetomatis]|uniref:Uncharacterized protein n=1 Tax=Madurella mycetomatis TaxID=100816 RepID=A0A175W923_9PEZI|nr:hypothetical protein MMYC01_204238 [Madurella mycetomatis]
MTPEDLAALDLHPATLQYTRRATTESRFWSADRLKLSLILSFSSHPKTPYDFLSMTYDLKLRLSTVLIRQSYNPRRHNLEDLDEYDHRLEACKLHWAHPFITPVVLLQVQFSRTEEAIADNISHVKSLESRVSNFSTSEFSSRETRKDKIIRRLSLGNEDPEKPPVLGHQNMASLMRNAHDVLKESIKLLDTVRWMERAVKLMVQAGDELAECTSTGDPGPGPSRLDIGIHDPDYPGYTDIRTFSQSFTGPLGEHWHEIRQYLEGLQRMCLSLETDRGMSEARCRAQIDIVRLILACKTPANPPLLLNPMLDL